MALLSANLLAALIEVEMSGEEEGHACVHEVGEERQVLLQVVVTALMLVLLAAEDGVVRVADDGASAQPLFGLRGELQLEELLEVAELRLELLAEEAGVAVPAEPGEEVFAGEADQDVTAQLNDVEVTVEVRPRGGMKGVFNQLEDVTVLDALVIARCEQQGQLRAERLQVLEEADVAAALQVVRQVSQQ